MMFKKYIDIYNKLLKLEQRCENLEFKIENDNIVKKSSCNEGSYCEICNNSYHVEEEGYFGSGYRCKLKIRCIEFQPKQDKI